MKRAAKRRKQSDMSKSAEKASEKERDEPQKSSVFDFLYCDSRRIGSFLAQFDDSGLLEKVVQRETASKDTKRGIAVNVGGGASVLGTGGSGSLGLNITPSVGGSEGSERTYDPLWANALTFLDFLDAATLIKRGADGARIGQFVLVKGSLAIMDLTLFKGMWQLPAIKSAIVAGANENPGTSLKEPQQNRKQRRASGQSGGHPASVQSPTETIEAGLALIGLLPHAVQTRVAVDGTNQMVWTSLREDALVVSSADLTLKHGIAIAGVWNMLGVLDALPDKDANGCLTESGESSIEWSSTLADSPFGAMMNQLLPVLRPMLGRPFSAYGMTPLMIFREISA